MSNILSDASSFSNPYGAPSTGEWNLSKGIYTTKVSNQSVVFFFETKKGEDPSQRTGLEQVADNGGRRVVKFEYPYLDGQKLADLGRKGETYNFNIKFYGLNYQQKLQDFLKVVFQNNEQGTIIHPVRGSLSVKPIDYEFIHRHDEWNAVTIRAIFWEDTTDALAQVNLPQASQDSALRSALQTLTNVQSTISTAITEVSALLLLPGAIKNALILRLQSIVNQVSGLLGQLAATFSSNKQLQNLSAQASAIQGGVTGLTAGTVKSTTTGSTVLAKLPPVFQVGLDETTQAAVQANINSFVNANQITPQQAVFNANQARTAIAAAISEANGFLGNNAYDIVLQYRQLAITIQESAEAAISVAQNQVKIFTVPSPMSLRKVAQLNGLSPDRQNDIEALNPYLTSINYVPAGTQLTVPIS